jgi:hypothetical protein
MQSGKLGGSSESAISLSLTSPAPALGILAPNDLAANVASYARHMRAENLSPATQRTYLASLKRLGAFLEANGMPTNVASIRQHEERGGGPLLRGGPIGKPARVRAPRFVSVRSVVGPLLLSGPDPPSAHSSAAMAAAFVSATPPLYCRVGLPGARPPAHRPTVRVGDGGPAARLCRQWRPAAAVRPGRA